MGKTTQAWRTIRGLRAPGAFFFLFMAFWVISTSFALVPQYLIPSPVSVIDHLRQNASLLLQDTGWTLLESLLGFVIGNAIGFLIAVLFVYCRPLENALYPYAIAFKAIPLVAIAPLITVWFGNGLVAKVMMASTICFFPAIVNSTRGLRSFDPEALELMYTLAANERTIFRKLRLPSSLPFIFSALKISSSLSVVGAIVAEMAGSDKGIGHYILISSYRNDTPALFSAIGAISIGAVVLFFLVAVIERRLLYWLEPTSDLAGA